MSAATTTRPDAPTRPRRGRGWWLLTGTTAALVVVCVVAAGAGQLAIPPGEVAGSVLHRLDAALEGLLGLVGLRVDLPLDAVAGPQHPQGDAALWQVRFPRI
ncbi:MAG TPA: hypothetical protein VKZ83_15115, partial [Phototrophicaceae bacterium]|nr:hypothetical protein [Phototrophicaceae bacterium]